MAVSTQRTVDIWEAESDLVLLTKGNFQFNIAKSVMDSKGNLSYNMIWHSQILAPKMSIDWTVQYALNWTNTVPGLGLTVTMGGFWKDTNPGDVWDIDQNGIFVASTAAKMPNYLKIGENRRAPVPGQNGIHIVVGIKTGNSYSPIWVDPTLMTRQMSSYYQPQEKVMWWYDTNTKSGSMFSGAVAQSASWDMSVPRLSDQRYYVSSTFIYTGGVGAWKTSPNDAPNQAMMVAADFSSASMFSIGDGNGSKDFAVPDFSCLSQSELTAMCTKLLANGCNTGQQKGIESLSLNKYFSFRATANWPRTVQTAIIAAGAAAIIYKLIDQGGRFKTTIKNSEFEWVFEFELEAKGPNASNNSTSVLAVGDELQQAQRVWNIAVAADAADGAYPGQVIEI